MNNRQLKKQLKSEKEKVKRLTRMSELLIKALRFNSIVSRKRLAEVAQKKLNEITGEKSG